MEEASGDVPVHLRGVFMGAADPAGIAFVIQDDTDGIYVQGPAEQVAGLGRGDLLEVEGVSVPGGYAPYVVAQRISRVGRAPIPEPIHVALDELNEGEMDAKWVEFSGIVRSVEPKAPGDLPPPPPGTRYASPKGEETSTGEAKVKMKLASGSARVTVEVNEALVPKDYVDGEVRIRGLCFNLHNRSRQFVRPFVQVPRGVEVQIEKPPPADPYDGQPRPIASLLRFEPQKGKHAHRVHVRGVVVYHRAGSFLWVRDRDHSLRVETTQKDNVEAGTEVDVLGFPAMGEYSAVLEDAVFRKLSHQQTPLPRVLTDMSSALQNDANLVQLVGRLTEIRKFADTVALTLDWHGTVVHAQMDRSDGAPVPSSWQAGSVVRVAGVCAVLTDKAGPLGGLWEPNSFQLILRTPADLAVIQPPPWWNLERMVWVLSAILLLAVAAAAAIMLASRRRLKEQERRRAMAEAEFAAILNERNRVAREIHDTLAQSLSAISVQLELARTRADEISPPARNHLGAAHKLARAALADARESIWNMRSHVLEKGDLAEALDGILQRMTDGTDVAGNMRVDGDRRRLPPVVENNLLRIGQEAITNAANHAKPTRIEVKLTFAEKTVKLEIEDDGVGFVPEASPNAGRRSFGLVGMKERAAALGGAVEIHSAPGAGTRVIVVVAV